MRFDLAMEFRVHGRRAAAGKAQVLGDTVATESGMIPAAATLSFFDSAYQQLLKGGANP